MTDYRLLDLASDQSLGNLVASVDRIGVDTEFMREKTFFSQLCLVQIAIEKDLVCADPLGLAEVDGAIRDRLWRGLTKPAWVLHSGRQDIEVIYQTCGLMPAALFDTQIAAALLGYQPQIGYAGLVAELFDVELAKSHTRADWSKRPLADAVMNYAAEDVAYLLPACDLLSERLDKLGRLEWARQDSADLLVPALYESDPDLAIDRLKGARNLHGRARATAKNLAAWREREALRLNRPRQWIIRDTVLIDISVSQPTDTSMLADIDGLAESTVRRVGDALLDIVSSATANDDGHVPPSRPDEKQKTMLKTMQQTTANVAQEHGIATEILAPKKELSAAISGQRNSRVFRGWRKRLVGDALIEILDNP